MCGHGRLLVNVVFSLTGIFHGSAGGMSSGHTWHWGTPERSYQIPLGKPGLVIPRCETLASRSVTFPPHQRESTALQPPPQPLFLAMRICNWGSKGKKSAQQKEKELSLLPPPLDFKKKIKNQRFYPFLSSSCCTDHETVLTQLEITNTSSQSGENPCTVSRRYQHFRTTNRLICFFVLSTMRLGVYSKGFSGTTWAQRS